MFLQLLAALVLGRALALKAPRALLARRRPSLRSHPTESFPAVATPEGVEARWRAYQDSYESSLRSDEFWGEQGRRLLTWFSPFRRVSGGGFEHGDVNWFSEGKLNACFNCVDRHLPQRANQV